MLGLTQQLFDNDYWMMDNEYSGEGDKLDIAMKLLGSTWKKLLKYSNKELNIDAEYSRPGIEALLQKFGDLLESTGVEGNELVWK